MFCPQDRRRERTFTSTYTRFNIPTKSRHTRARTHTRTCVHRYTHACTNARTFGETRPARMPPPLPPLSSPSFAHSLTHTHIGKTGVGGISIIDLHVALPKAKQRKKCLDLAQTDTSVPSTPVNPLQGLLDCPVRRSDRAVRSNVQAGCIGAVMAKAT